MYTCKNNNAYDNKKKCLGKRNLISSFTDFWGEILGRRTAKKKKKKEKEKKRIRGESTFIRSEPTHVQTFAIDYTCRSILGDILLQRHFNFKTSSMMFCELNFEKEILKPALTA
jgi:hypothetical protein